MLKYIVVTYRLSCGSKAEATRFARTIAREQTVEVPPGVGDDAVQERVMGRVLERLANGRCAGRRPRPPARDPGCAAGPVANSASTAK